MSTYLTITERFRDEHRVLRYEYVSWPVYKDEGNHWYVKDVDSIWFSVPKDKAIESDRPSRLGNMDILDIECERYDDGIADYNRRYKDMLGIDQERNTHVQHRYGMLDPEEKKKRINGKDYGKAAHGEEERPKGYQRNLGISSQDV